MAPRRTKARAAIAAELLRGRGKTHYGYELSRSAGVGGGSMYPFLRELHEGGYLEDGWDAEGESRAGPPRRYYRLTDSGIGYLADFLSGSFAPTQPRASLASVLKPKALGT